MKSYNILLSRAMCHPVDDLLIRIVVTCSVHDLLAFLYRCDNVFFLSLPRHP